MGNRADVAAVMPAMLDHEGWWEGWYRDVDPEGNWLDERRVKTHCEFPDTGEWHYIQHNWISWADGREAVFEFGGRLDAPGAYYVEMINLEPEASHRARTWQWVKDSQPWKRTLCDEWRIEAE